MYPVLHVITSPSWGGLEMYVVSLIKEQALAGARVAAFVLPNTRVEAELRASNIPLHLAQKNSHFHLQDIRQLRTILKAEAFPIIHSHTSRDVWPASLAAYGTRVAHVCSVYVVAMAKRDPHHWIIYRRVDALVSSSTYVNERLGRELPIRRKRIRLVRYGRYLDQFVRSGIASREKMRKELGLSEGQLAFGIIGRIEPSKGVREFAESLLELDPEIRMKVKYFVIGARPDESHDSYNAWLLEFQQRPEVCDHLSILPWQPNPIDYYGALDALVMASHREMYSLSVLDAMAMSLPVIGTDAEGTTEQIGNNERGLLVEPRSSTSIAQAVAQYVANPLLMREHGVAGHAWVHREHSMSQSLKSLDRVYAAAAARRKRSISLLPQLC
jgi:glycosyltransferase involved in cell wall biosynthesis